MSHHEYEAENFQVGELTVRIIQDTDAFNPREEYDNVGKMICFHRNYDLGDKHDYEDPEAFLRDLASNHHEDLDKALDDIFEQTEKKMGFVQGQSIEPLLRAAYEAKNAFLWKIINEHYIILPLGLYDHSGITMYVGSGHSPFDPGGWDSGQVGWIYCDEETLQKEWGKYYPNETREQLVERAEKYLRGEVETFDQYLTGDVWGYTVKHKGKLLDSCWGFFGIEYARQEASDAAQREWDDIVEERRKAEETERHAQEWEPRMMAI